jgi:hypothetical protein
VPRAVQTSSRARRRPGCSEIRGGGERDRSLCHARHAGDTASFTPGLRPTSPRFTTWLRTIPYASRAACFGIRLRERGPIAASPERVGPLEAEGRKPLAGLHADEVALRFGDGAARRATAFRTSTESRRTRGDGPALERIEARRGWPVRLFSCCRPRIRSRGLELRLPFSRKGSGRHGAGLASKRTPSPAAPGANGRLTPSPSCASWPNEEAGRSRGRLLREEGRLPSQDGKRGRGPSEGILDRGNGGVFTGGAGKRSRPRRNPQATLRRARPEPARRQGVLGVDRRASSGEHPGGSASHPAEAISGVVKRWDPRPLLT